ncbi:segregation/condensation protein A [Amylibacter sp.]|nr:segregation/condensation protein A [Amylibacter sp.]MDA9313578.1 segregation/condensation protein A [Amylibacter sp.]MDB0015140.1 segregation/condensation protein A [Amylibacter sp.]MDC0008633.1 segregation/condensation protein A [Amylibacter sp.]MDC1445710.1 segregation/condensation protein A [Amylibacter sp.]|tara:strand:- start:2843 stop:3625 length:783 start_codon:yes stop_codon:yes gene_type:complete
MESQSNFDINLEQRISAENLVIDVDGFEGPLDLLLTLARTQKVDMRKISILQLAKQYLTFVEEAKRIRLELAADYLVMAAWLAFIKSRLLLPQEAAEDGPSGEELAAHLAFQLERLEAMRRSASKLMARDQLGRDFFGRGILQDVTLKKNIVYKATVLDLMQAYARLRVKENFKPLHIEERNKIFTMEQALERMKSLIGHAIEWGTLEQFMPAGWLNDPKRRRSVTASTFAAMLELVKLGKLDLRQNDTFSQIEIKQKEN